MFCVLMILTVGLALAHEGNLAVYDAERSPWLSAMQVATNLAIGPAEPLLRRSLYGAAVYSTRETPGPGNRERRRALRARFDRSFRTWNGYGTAYFYLAGLMNILLILDAWDLGIGRKR